jgi:flagellar biogenesis protein FliO
MRKYRKWILALAIAGASPACFAQSTNAMTLHTDLPNLGVSAVRAVAALAVVLALFFAGVWVFRNGQRLTWRKTGPPKLAVLESRALGNRLALYVVGYEDQRLLIGSSPAGLNLLSPLPAAPAITVDLKTSEQPASFSQYFQRVLQRK